MECRDHDNREEYEVIDDGKDAADDDVIVSAFDCRISEVEKST